MSISIVDLPLITAVFIALLILEIPIRRWADRREERNRHV